MAVKLKNPLYIYRDNEELQALAAPATIVRAKALLSRFAIWHINRALRGARCACLCISGCTANGVIEISENRHIKINYPGSGNNSQFTYDGFGHNVAIIETTGGTVSSTKQFVWAKGAMQEARNASGSVTAQYFDRGQTISSSSYFYTKDHLGSIREMSDSSGNVQAVYTYDPYGKPTKLQGSLASDFQYCGYYFHAFSGLGLTLNRAYNAVLGRWINRDPIRERGGINLYAYVRNKPATYVDYLGTDANNCSGYAHCEGRSEGSPYGRFWQPFGGESFGDFYKYGGWTCKLVDSAAACDCHGKPQLLALFSGGSGDPMGNDTDTSGKWHEIGYDVPIYGIHGYKGWSEIPGPTDNPMDPPSPVDPDTKYPGPKYCCCKDCSQGPALTQ
jgi:RHS repeat-associated protein